MNEGQLTVEIAQQVGLLGIDAETASQMCRDCSTLGSSLIKQIVQRCAGISDQENATRLMVEYTNQLRDSFDSKYFTKLICKRGGQCHADVFKILIDGGADVNVAVADGKTPLIVASSLGYISLAKLLIERGALPEQIDEKGETALNHAVAAECDDMAHFLLHFSADENHMVPPAELKCNSTVLHVAVGHGLARCVDHILRNHVDRNSFCDCWDSRPANANAGDARQDVVHASSQERLDVNCKDRLGNTPLHWLARRRSHTSINSADILRALVERGAVVNERNSYGRTPLHFAVINNDENLVRSLVETYGADVNAVDYCGNTSLHMRFAASRPRESHETNSLIEKLLEYGAELNAANVEGMTPLHVACNRKFRTSNSIDLLIRRGASINVADIRGMTPLHHMFVKDTRDASAPPSFVASLFDNLINSHRADITRRTHYGLRSPLHLAVSRSDSLETNREYVVPQLLKSVSIADALYNTPLHYDIGKFEDLLCHEGKCEPANHAKNKCGRSPYLNNARDVGFRFPSCIADDEDWMRRNILHMYCNNDKFLLSFVKMRMFLLRCRELDLFERKDLKGRSSLHHLCISGIFEDSIKLSHVETQLFKLFHDCLNDRDYLGRSALFYAVLYQHDYVAAGLLDAGADPGIPDNEGIFPENIAAARGRKEVADTLAAARLGGSSCMRECVCSRRDNHSINTGLVLSVSDEDKRASLPERSQMKFKEFVRFMNHDIDDKLTDSVQEHVATFVTNVMSKVAQLNPIFSSVIHLVGSSQSRTRIKYPGDFDFSVVLTSFEKVVTVQESVEFTHCVTFRRNSSVETADATSAFENFFTPDGTLDTQHIKHELYLLIIEATSLPDVWHDDVFEYLKLIVRCEATSPAIKLMLTPNRMWINRTGETGKTEKKLYIRSLSVDVVPCLRTGQPLLSSSPLGLLTAEYATGLDDCIAIFKQPMFCLRTQDEWTLSCYFCQIRGRSNSSKSRGNASCLHVAENSRFT